MQKPYGESKVLAQNSDKSVFILRPCMIHGPGNEGNLNLLYKVIRKSIPAFDNRRSFTSIDNLCFVIDRLISENSRPGVYHIADDEPLSTNELISGHLRNHGSQSSNMVSASKADEWRSMDS